MLRRPILFLLLVLLLAVPAFADSLSVPFVAQKAGYCGPAALAMLAQYYGQKVTQDEIAQAIYLPDVHGTLTTDLADYAKHFGFWVRQYRGTQVDVRQKTSAGVPVIVLGKFGTQFHYFVVLGFDDFAKTVTVHSDRRAKVVMPQEEFWRYWDNADHWTLLICPPDRATWKLTAAENNDLGLFLEQTGKLAAAAGHYRVAAELEPKNSYYPMNLGNALRKQHLLRESAEAFSQAVKLDPDNADALNNLADVYCELNANLDEAVALCQRAVKLWPSHRAYYLDTLGGVFLKQGKRSEAIDAFEQALQATSERQSALHTAIQQHLKAAQAK